MSFRAKIFGSLDRKQQEQVKALCKAWYAVILQKSQGVRIDETLLVDLQAILFELGLSQPDAITLALDYTEDQLWREQKLNYLNRVVIRLGQLDAEKQINAQNN